MANYPNLEALSDDLAALISRAGRWTVAVQGGRGPNSSGVLWDAEHVLTAEFSLSNESVEVGLPDGRSASATVLGRMTGWDLALLKLSEPLQSEPPPWSAEPKPGLIISLGRSRPGGGLISSVGMLNSVEHGLQHRSAFGPHFAGGPIVDCRGAFLGLNVHGRPPEGVPYKKLQAAVAELSQGRSVEPGYLGLGLLALEQGGCLVIKVESGSPAEKARIMLGDQISHLDGVPVNGPEEAQRELRSMGSERLINVSLSRRGQAMEIEVQLGARPHRGAPGGPGRPFFRAIRKIIRHAGPGRHHGPDRHFGPDHPDHLDPDDHFGPPPHHGPPDRHDPPHRGPDRGRHRGGPPGPPPPHHHGPQHGPHHGPPFDDGGPEVC